MTLRVKLRLGFYLFATAAALVGGGWVSYNVIVTMHQVEQSERDAKSLEDLSKWYSSIGNYIPPAAMELNRSLIHLATTDSHVEWAQFEGNKTSVERFIAEQRSVAPQAKVMILQPVRVTSGVAPILE